MICLLCSLGIFSSLSVWRKVLNKRQKKGKRGKKESLVRRREKEVKSTRHEAGMLFPESAGTIHHNDSAPKSMREQRQPQGLT